MALQKHAFLSGSVGGGGWEGVEVVRGGRVQWLAAGSANPPYSLIPSAI